jgi:hypothetical protein
MKRILFSLMCLFLAIGQGIAQVDLSYYLPKDVSYNPAIPTPKQVLGYEPGEWHVTHDQLVMYMRAVAAASNRVTIEEQGRTYENRPLLLLTVTHPENQPNIETIRQNHLKLSDASASGSVDLANMPSIIWMGFSVHGNEPSGSNASLLTIYYLAAAQGAKIDEMLKKTVVLLDPCFNPDGLNRFATWVNIHKAKNINPDPNDREYSEVWPGGRTNHYWFDLNRDWLPVQLVESKARITNYHKWKPNILTDHHEMGTNSSFFFQPGVPERTHPLTPKKNQELTAKIATYHAKFLDQIQSLYYTKEGFDDFYYGKGSTMPDINGGIGILFEQASSRGHAQESVNGILTFPFTVRNQFTTTLSTWQAGFEMREELLGYMRDFYRDAAREAAADPMKAIVFGASKDKARAYHMVDILKRHEYDVYETGRAFSANGHNFEPGSSFVVPVNQRDYRMLKGMFERRTKFEDSLFYDISAWSYLLAFDLEFAELTGANYNTNMLGKKIDDATLPAGKIIGGQSKYAYLFEWHPYYAPRAANQLMEAGLRLKVATAPIIAPDGKKFDMGTVLLSLGIQDVPEAQIHQLVEKVARENGIDVYAVETGLTDGINLGSPSFSNMIKPEIALLVEGGVSGNDAGEIWFLLDQRMDMKVTKLPINRVNSADLSRYNVIIMVNGNYAGINKDRLQAWVQQGGTIVAFKSALNWLSANGLGGFKFKSAPRDRAYVQYDLQSQASGAQGIFGAIFQAEMDLTHPLTFGYYKKQIPIFRNSSMFLETPSNLYASPINYTRNPLMSGYITPNNLKTLSGTPAVVVGGSGSGRIIGFSDNHAFRAFWFGPNKLVMNSIFFGHTISGSALERGDE